MLLIIYIMIAFIIILLVYDKLTRKYVNPYKTILYYGKKGCGKTTYLTKLAINKIKEGKTVYSTVEIPGTRLFNPKDLNTYKPITDSVILIDEIGLIWDNRDFKSFEKGVNQYFKYARQYRNEIHMFSQVPDIDLKIRNLCDSYYLLENKLRVFSYGKRISKVLTVKTDIEGKGNLVDSFEFAPLLSPKARILTFIPRWSEFYESFDPPSRENLPYKDMALNERQLQSIKNHKVLVLKDYYENIKTIIKDKFDKIYSWFFVKIMK